MENIMTDKDLVKQKIRLKMMQFYVKNKIP